MRTVRAARNRAARGLAAAALATFLAGIPACKSKDDRALIEGVIDRAIAAANEKRAGEVVKEAKESFRGPHGADLRECRRILTGYFFSEGWIRVFEKSLDIEVDGTHATARLEAVLARGRPVEKIEDVIPTNADIFEFVIGLEKIDGDWMLANASYEPKRWE